MKQMKIMTSHLEKFHNKYGRLPTENDPDYLEMLKMSKFRILSKPDSSPGKCASCGGFKEDGRKYVDFGLYVDWYGTVLLCSLCAKEMAEVLGFIQEINQEEIAHPDFKVDIETSVENLQKTLREYYEYMATRDTNSSNSVDDNSNSI